MPAGIHFRLLFTFLFGSQWVANAAMPLRAQNVAAPIRIVNRTIALSPAPLLVGAQPPQHARKVLSGTRGALIGWKWKKEPDKGAMVYTATSKKTPKQITLITGIDAGEKKLFDSILDAQALGTINQISFTLQDFPVLLTKLAQAMPGQVTIFIQSEIVHLYDYWNMILNMLRRFTLNHYEPIELPSQTQIIAQLMEKEGISREDGVLAILVERLAERASQSAQSVRPGQEEEEWNKLLIAMVKGLARYQRTPFSISELNKIARERLGRESGVDAAIETGNAVLRQAYSTMLDQTEHEITKVVKDPRDIWPDHIYIRVAPQYLPALDRKKFADEAIDFAADPEIVKGHLRAFGILKPEPPPVIEIHDLHAATEVVRTFYQLGLGMLRAEATHMRAMIMSKRPDVNSAQLVDFNEFNVLLGMEEKRAKAQWNDYNPLYQRARAWLISHANENWMRLSEVRDALVAADETMNRDILNTIGLSPVQKIAYVADPFTWAGYNEASMRAIENVIRKMEAMIEQFDVVFPRPYPSSTTAA
jgi:hypothetical protein